MQQDELDRLIAELTELPRRIASLRAEVSELASQRRELAARVVEIIGPTETARRLGISRQTLWQILQPERAREIKRRSARRSPLPSSSPVGSDRPSDEKS